MAERFHLIGIGGIGVSGVARGLRALGYEVTGSDVRGSVIIDALRAEGVPVTVGHRPENVHGADHVVVSTAITADNCEIAEATRLGIPVEHRSLTLERITSRFTSVGVSGTNGKGTVSSMLTAVLEAWGKEPSFIIGGILEAYGTNARVGGSDFLVAEVDESDGSLVNVHPDVAVIANLELDHLNYYKSFDEVLAKVAAFLTGNSRLRFAVLQTGDAGSRRLIEATPGVRHVTFSSKPAWPADYLSANVTFDGLSSSFDVVHGGQGLLGRVTLNVPGLYNVENALAAIAAAHTLGTPFSAVQAGLAAFRGLRNRFTLARAGESVVVKDFISHPTGMRRVLEALRRLVGPDFPVVAVFKPYRFTFIRYLGDEYARSFVDADLTVITEMWDGHEEPIPGINTKYLVDKIAGTGTKVDYVPDHADIVPALLARYPGAFATIFFGGVDLFEEADRLVRLLGERC
jgi:UDP-N-acetylmuramate--alanine ligase